MTIKTYYTENEAQALHDQRKASDPEHDRCSCWCCCLDCDFDYDRILETPNSQHSKLTNEGSSE